VNPMLEKIAHLWPEIIMLAGAVACLFIGLSSDARRRRSTVYVALGTLIVAAMATVIGSGDDPVAQRDRCVASGPRD